MTWREVKNAALQRMFLIEGDAPAPGENVRSFVAAMPAAANEAVMLICAAGAGPRGEVVIEHAGSIAGRMEAYDLRERVPDFYRLCEDGVRLERDDHVWTNPCYDFRGDSTLLIEDARPGRWRVAYYRRPERMTGLTVDEQEIGLGEDAAVLLPLYIAGQLYRDDDIQQATLYRNEFESGLERLRHRTAPREWFESGRRWV